MSGQVPTKAVEDTLASPIDPMRNGSGELYSTSPSSPQAAQPNAFVRSMRKVYNPLGFQKGYNFPLFIIFAGAMLGFFLARAQYLNVAGQFSNKASPFEWYWYKDGHYRIGITIHLACSLPMGFLMIWQFVPVIRLKALLFHRINGYIVILLGILTNVGALMICRRSFGGTLPTQAGVGTLAILTTLGLSMAYYNIKRLQIEQHRAWMLRSMFWFGSIITIRIIMSIAASVISLMKDYYSTHTCDEIAFLYGGQMPRTRYPQCYAADGTAQGHVAVHADFTSTGRDGATVGAALDLSFGMATWMALFLHTIGVEIYLKLTPRESDRLRCISYEKQLEAGFKHAGSAGLTIDRWGDAEPWSPPLKNSLHR